MVMIDGNQPKIWACLMGRLRWYKRDPNAALTGMMVLTLEERGAYNTVLDLIYAHDGRVIDDDRYLAGLMRCDVRVWRRIKQRLTDLGKLYVSEGYLRNQRADEVVDRGLSRVSSAEQAGRASAASRKAGPSNGNGLATTVCQRPLQPNKNENLESERKKESLSEIQTRSRDPVGDAPNGAKVVSWSEVDFVSTDGAVRFEASEIKDLERCYRGIKDIRALIRHGVREQFKHIQDGMERRRAVLAWLAKKNEAGLLKIDRDKQIASERQAARDTKAKPKYRGVMP